ncbi:MAG: DUF805 domain-containing protein [Selenomonadaceae bacterium]|nr:DUF805 domain-containing protein [Selenomonadaceae bacterium]
MSDFEKFLREYFTASGRIGRKRYGDLMFKMWLPLMATAILEWLIVDAWELANRFPHVVFAVRAVMYTLTIFFWVSLPFVATRRLHDIGKSGWWSWLLIVMSFAPITGSGVLVFIFAVWLGHKDGDAGKNKYGDPPPDD